MIARLAPTSDSTVRSIKSSRACTSTCTVTSSGMRFSSINRRLNSNSVFDADGKPTSISLKPHRTSASKSSSFCDTFIGTASAWLPSRRSTLHQIGARVKTRLGHCRFGKATGGKGRYLLLGLEIIIQVEDLKFSGSHRFHCEQRSRRLREKWQRSGQNPELRKSAGQMRKHWRHVSRARRNFNASV